MHNDDTTRNYVITMTIQHRKGCTHMDIKCLEKQLDGVCFIKVIKMFDLEYYLNIFPVIRLKLL